MTRYELEMALRRLYGAHERWQQDGAAEEVAKVIERMIEENVKVEVNRMREEILTTLIPAGYLINPAGWR